MNKDLTIIFLTVNKVPKKWAEYQKQVLLEAADGASIITISKEPLDWGLNILQTAEPSILNIYKQVLIGAELATTPYIAIAEDDCLYHKEHFQYRPPDDTFGYDGNRWGLLTWDEPTYYWKDRISNAALIAPRELVIKSLRERFLRYPNNEITELGNEKGTKLDRQKFVNFYPSIGMVFFSHIDALDRLEQTKKKRMGMVRAYDIPYWRKSKELVKKFI